MRKPAKFLGALAVAGLVAAGGSAFTASNTIPDSVAGYGSSAVTGTGATATGVAHTLSADGLAIESSLLTFNVSQEGRTIEAGFGVAGDLQNCIVAGTPFLTATCDYDIPPLTAGAVAFNVAVS
jgi:hypothetical protein